MATNITEIVPTGAIRFNTDSNKMECFNGTKWMQVSVSSPDLDGGARGLIAGGRCPSFVATIDYINISAASNALDFGDLTVARESAGGCASRTRGLFAGGYHPGSGDDEIDYITFSSTGNAIDFGNTINEAYAPGALSNETRGVFGGGHANLDLIQYVTIASTGNAVDFDGNLTKGRRYAGGVASPTRGIFGGGDNQPSSASGDAMQNVLDYITITSTGYNASDFGDLIQRTHFGVGSAGNSVRGIWSCGMLGWAPSWASSTVTNYVTIATLGNAQTFGDLTQSRGYSGGVSSPIRVCIGGGFHGPSTTRYNTIDYVTIATQGDFVDFGDLLDTRTAPGANSNAHGGL